MSAPYKKRGGRGGGGRGHGSPGGRGRESGGNRHSNDGGRGHGKHGGGGGRGGGNEKGQSNVLTTMLRLVFEKNAQVFVNGVVNLNNFKQCGDLQSVTSSIDFNTKSFCQSLCSVIKDFYSAPQFISIENNNVTSLHHFLDALIQYDLHSTLKGLDVANNGLKSLDFLKAMRRFENLHELKFEGNPVTQQADYLQKIRKAVPQLLGIDGVAVQRPPLGLPWPVAGQRSEDMTQILIHLDTNLFQTIAARGVDAAVGAYHTNATFTLTLAPDFHLACRTENNDKQAGKDLAQFKNRQKDKDRNLIASQHITRVAIGRAKVCSALIDSIYPKNVAVLHELDTNADIVPLQAGVKTPLVMVSMHGVMKWKHNNQSETDKFLNAASFDRTFTMIHDGTGWSITNDLVHLRKHRGEAIMLPKSASRVQALSRKYNVDPNLVLGACEMASSDGELDPILTDLQLPGEILAQCAQVAGNDVKATILVSRVVSHYRLQPQFAMQALREADGNLEGVVPIIQGKYNGTEHRIPG